MSAGLRRAALTAHVTASVAWLGAVVAFLALAVAGETSPDPGIVRAAYLAMDLITWLVIVPLDIAAVLTGVLQSLFTAWGLFQYYWTMTKLGLTLVATIVLLIKTRLISHLAGVAARTVLASTDLPQMRTELVVHAGGGAILLIVILALSIYKPWGRTAYGIRKLERHRSRRTMLASRHGSKNPA
jgi:hypothetical protein